MKFYEPKPGTPEAVNMSDDNSDGVSTDDCGTPPEYNTHNYDVNTPEENSTPLNEGIVLYLRRQNVASEVIEEEDEESEEDTAEQVHPRCHSPPNSVFFQDLGLDENIEGMEQRFDNIRGTRFYNPASLFQVGRHSLIPLKSTYAMPPLSLSPINTEDENDSSDTESSNSDDRSSDYLNQMD